jgi:hypothetical protein
MLLRGKGVVVRREEKGARTGFGVQISESRLEAV